MQPKNWKLDNRLGRQRILKGGGESGWRERSTNRERDKQVSVEFEACRKTDQNEHYRM